MKKLLELYRLRAENRRLQTELGVLKTAYDTLAYTASADSVKIIANNIRIAQLEKQVQQQAQEQR